ncbi:WVELL protein [Alteribacillus persepolensis]|uniref:WVELL protein n=1 Tax=Alteribacillus persepolensis TaxID=568899 RepID=A0A1G8CCW4_9BACI|nr:YfhJ family protein [Alteribacillus persepolensis]SDH43218.1 WVELL protein [Alteribacillus persepolensis]
MEDIYQRLTKKLLDHNEQLSAGQARTWVEHLWEDFEVTRAKSGREYQGSEVTESIVGKWIEQYGPYLHQYEATNMKFHKLNQRNDYLTH